jgi:hypothetical protein
VLVCGSTIGPTPIRIPPLGTENDDANRPRIAPHVFNTTALYNFLSTFAGTHFVTPRAVQAELTVRF